MVGLTNTPLFRQTLNKFYITMKTDEMIQKDVTEELHWDPILNACKIGVAVSEGVVTLSGEVNTYRKKIATEHAAQRVEGVRAIVQEIIVTPVSVNQYSDLQIAHAIISSFEWHTEIPHEDLKIKVQKGWVTLEGEVNWNYQRQAAERMVSSIGGVKGLTNLIIVKPIVEAQDVKNKISNALKRSAIVKAQKIKVETNGNKVTLAGRVRSWYERRAAEAAAWSAPGITSVVDNITISA